MTVVVVLVAIVVAGAVAWFLVGRSPGQLAHPGGDDDRPVEADTFGPAGPGAEDGAVVGQGSSDAGGEQKRTTRTRRRS